jgi:hypothetical protein
VRLIVDHKPTTEGALIGGACQGPGQGPVARLVAGLREATLTPLVVTGDERLMTGLEAPSLGADCYYPRPVLEPLSISRVRSLFRRWGRQQGTAETQRR